VGSLKSHNRIDLPTYYGDSFTLLYLLLWQSVVILLLSSFEPLLCRVMFRLYPQLQWCFFNSSFCLVTSVSIDEYTSILQIQENNLIKAGIRQCTGMEQGKRGNRITYPLSIKGKEINLVKDS
jgi:hypothetical protein